MSEPRRLAVIGFLSLLAGGFAHIGFVLSGGGGLSGGYVAGLLGTYLLLGVVVLITVGVGVAGFARRRWGITLMLIAALFEVGYLIGSQIALSFLIIPGARSN